MTGPRIPRLAWDEITPLPDNLRTLYDLWRKQNEVSDEDADQSAYDYQGAFRAGINRDPVGGHFPDTFKQHGHESFSRESKYSRGEGDGGRWEGETYIPAHVKGDMGTSGLLQRVKRLVGGG